MNRAILERHLPEILRRGIVPGGPLDALLAVMEGMLAPIHGRLPQLDRWLDPWRAPEPFLPFLASLVDLEEAAGLRPPLPAGRLRALIAAAAELARWRGTGFGLVRAFELATGVQGFRLDEAAAGPDGSPRAFHLEITAPAEALPWRHALLLLLERQKPVAVSARLTFAAPTPDRTPTDAEHRDDHRG